MLNNVFNDINKEQIQSFTFQSVSVAALRRGGGRGSSPEVIFFVACYIAPPPHPIQNPGAPPLMCVNWTVLINIKQPF